TAAAAIERTSFAFVVSKNCDSERAPTNQRASKLPARVLNGCAVRSSSLGIPAALSLMIIALRMPGPHHMFSEVAPTSTSPVLYQIPDCPGMSRPMGELLNRQGRSAEYGCAYQRLANPPRSRVCGANAR